MSRDFEKDRVERRDKRETLLTDRQFSLGGETFVYRVNVRTEILERLTSTLDLLGGDYIRAVRESCLEMIEDDCSCFDANDWMPVVKKDDGKKDDGPEKPPTPWDMHDGPNHRRFLALLGRKKDPITLFDLQEVFQGLVQEAFKRPTQASLPSGDGDATTGGSSTENSSTAPAAAAAA